MTDQPERLSLAPDVPLEDVKWRVQGNPTDRKTAQFVPYVDASIVSRLLDQWVGPTGWRDVYEPATGKGLWCHLSIRDPETGEWVTKTDIGVPSNMEAEKGLVSDAFKRAACLKWGVARNVYALPTTWAPCDVRDRGGKQTAYPNDKTIPAILERLRLAGFENAVVREGAADESHEDTADRPAANAPTSDASPEILALIERAKQLPLDLRGKLIAKAATDSGDENLELEGWPDAFVTPTWIDAIARLVAAAERKAAEIAAERTSTEGGRSVDGGTPTQGAHDGDGRNDPGPERPASEPPPTGEETASDEWWPATLEALQAEVPDAKRKALRVWAVAQGLAITSDGLIDGSSITEESIAEMVAEHLHGLKSGAAA